MTDFNRAMCEEEVLLTRYVDLEWSDDVRGFECARCGRVLIRHYIANCEHKFCSNCHKLLGDGSQRWRCPSCQQFITTIERQDFEFRKRVYELCVHCPNRKYGCDHTCPLKELKVHIDGCEHTRERALPVLIEGDRSPQMLDELLELRAEVKEMRAEVKEMRQMMMRVEKRCDHRDTERNRQVEDINSRIDGISSKLQVENKNEEKLNLKNEISSVVEENKSKILKLDVKSDVLMDMLDIKEKKLQTETQNVKKQIENHDETINKMHQSIIIMEREFKESRAKIEENVEKLKADTENFLKEKIEKVEEEIRHCNKLFDMKLNEQMLRVNERVDDDISQLNRKLMEVSKEFSPNKIQLSEYNLVEHNNSFLPDFQWKISGIKEKLEQENFEIQSEVFQWEKYPIRARAKLKVGEDKVSMSLDLKELNAGKAIDLKLIPHVYYVFKDRTKTNSPKHRCRTKEYYFTSKFDYSLTFDSSICHKSSLADPVNISDDSIAIDVYVEPPKKAKKAYSYNGTLEWTIDHYHEKIEMEKEELVWYHESPYFYTGPKGYRVQVRMVLRDGLRAYFQFLSGEFDAELPLTFSYRLTITLLNRKDPQRNVTKTLEKDIETEQWFIMYVCSEGEKESVIENDSLNCKVTIEKSETVKVPEKKKTFRFF